LAEDFDIDHVGRHRLDLHLYCSSSVRTRSGLASGLSILLMAMIIGTFAALA